MKKKQIYARNLRLLKYRFENPGASYEDIGQEFGITKQAVSSIIKKMMALVIR